MTTRLPLLPLNAVLVPGLVLPLHVFEPRYRVLVQALMALPEGATRHFGVIAIRSGAEVAGSGPSGSGSSSGPSGPSGSSGSSASGSSSGEPALYDVGCTAELREVTPYADGRFDIVSVGESRFRLLRLDPDAGTPYQTGVVELLPERDGPDDLPRLAEQATRLFTRYREALGVELSELPDDPQVISYLVAAAVVLDLPERQALLETPTTAARLRTELDLLRRERAMVSTFHALPAVELTKNPANPN